MSYNNPTELELLRAKAAQYDAMVRQRDAFRDAYTMLKDDVNSAYRALEAVIAERDDDGDDGGFEWARTLLLAGWKRAKARADEATHPGPAVPPPAATTPQEYWR